MQIAEVSASVVQAAVFACLARSACAANPHAVQPRAYLHSFPLSRGAPHPLPLPTLILTSHTQATMEASGKAGSGGDGHAQRDAKQQAQHAG